MIWHLVLCILSRYSTQTRSLPWQDSATSSVCEIIVAVARFFLSASRLLGYLLFSPEKKGGKRNKGAFLFFRSGYRQQMYARQKKKEEKDRKWEELCTVQRYSNKKQMVQNKSSYVDVFGSICQRKTKIKFDFFFSSAIRI